MYNEEELKEILDNEVIYGESQILKELRENSGICEECGKPFEQGFRIKKETGEKTFNKYKYCPKCRQNLSKKQEEKTTTVSIKYNPYPWQKKFHSSKARFKVVSGAARSGKDFSFDKEFAEKFVTMLNEKRSYSLIPRVHRLGGWTYL